VLRGINPVFGAAEMTTKRERDTGKKIHEKERPAVGLFLLKKPATLVVTLLVTVGGSLVVNPTVVGFSLVFSTDIRPTRHSLSAV
jgi:hypothetical protein